MGIVDRTFFWVMVGFILMFFQVTVDTRAIVKANLELIHHDLEAIQQIIGATAD